MLSWSFRKKVINDSTQEDELRERDGLPSCVFVEYIFTRDIVSTQGTNDLVQYVIPSQPCHMCVIGTTRYRYITRITWPLIIVLKVPS